MEDIILIGGGGHCKSVIDSIRSTESYRIIGILDRPARLEEEIVGIKIIGTDADMNHYYRKGIKKAFLTVGSIGDPSLRQKLYQEAIEIGYKFPNIIDSSATISDAAILGTGNFVGKGVIINADTRIGDNCIINTGVIIEHDCTIESFCHIAPGTVLSGNVKIAENTHIGTNSTLIQNIQIGKNSIIGAGSVVIKNIGDNVKAYGNPCKKV